MNNVICGDCLDIMSGMPAGSVDLVVTSPPYADRRKKQYGGISADKYVGWFMPRADEMRRVMRERGSLVIVIKEHTVDGERSEYVMDLIRAMRRGGWKWIDEYVWNKPNPTPGFWPMRLKDGFERCLHFTKSREFCMYHDAVKTKIKPTSEHCLTDKVANKWNASQTGTGFNRNYARYNRITQALPSNVITATVTHGQHPAVFPLKIPTFFIKLFTQPGDTVLDPFCGSGTTLKAAATLGRKYIGIDTSAEYCKNAHLRVSKVQQVMEAST